MIIAKRPRRYEQRGLSSIPPKTKKTKNPQPTHIPVDGQSKETAKRKTKGAQNRKQQNRKQNKLCKTGDRMKG